MFHYAQKFKRANFNLSPKASWDIFFEICKCYQGQHKRRASKQFQDAHGDTGLTNAHNADIIANYFTNVYNQEVQIEEDKINKLPQ